MKAHLMYRDRDFDLQALLPPNESDLAQDLELNTVYAAMGAGDDFLLKVARHSVLSSLHEERETILYRQAILQDCLRNSQAVISIYNLAVETIEMEKGRWWGIFGNYPRSIVHGAGELLRVFMDMLGRLRRIADEHAGTFESEGFRTLFGRLQAELTDDYFATVRDHLKVLKLDGGVLMSAELGKGNVGVRHVLRRSLEPEPRWFERLFVRRAPAFTFHLHPRDEAGARALSELQDRGLNLVANALAQSSDHILSFFVMLRAELGFYVGCVNLHRALTQKRVSVCFPVPAAPGSRQFSCSGLRDAGLVLTTEETVVGNDMAADWKDLVVITGANQGGKSTFLRAVGVAQLMMQCGMFVVADSFRAEGCRGLYTHYKREEDASMTSGKFDEELARMNRIVERLGPNAMVLFNESFAATNEREGSEIARQIVGALVEARIRVFFVTHMYEFAHGLWEEKRDSDLFLRAERQNDGQRTFKLHPGEPLQTSFGLDLYKEIFGGAGSAGEG